MWYLLDVLVSACKYMQDNYFSHGDIQARTVHIDDSGEIKLLDNAQLFVNEKENYFKMLSNPEYVCPLSPALFYNLKHKAMNPKHDRQQSEVWSIGMLAMCYAGAQDFELFYDTENYRIRYDFIKRNFDRLQKMGFSDELVHVLSNMLEETELKRVTINELHEFIANIQTAPEDDDDLSLLPTNPLAYLPLITEPGTSSP